MNGIYLEWSRCPDGVELVDFGAEPETPVSEVLNPGNTLLSGTEKGPYGFVFHPRSDAKIPVRYDLLDLVNPIVINFLNAKNRETRAVFLSKVGFLENYGFTWEQEYDVAAERLATLLSSAASGVPSEAIAAVEPILRTVPTGMRFDFSLPGRPPRIAFRVTSLLNYMKMECIIAATAGAKLVACENCGTHFLAGPTTGHRIDTRYCSTSCRVLAMRKRKAEKGNENVSS